MECRQPVRVLLEIHQTGETVCGQVAIEGASPRDFFGWLELIDRLEHAAGSGSPDTPVEPHDRGAP